MKRRFLTIVTAAAAAAFAVDRSPEANAWWSHVLVLADDEMEGRKAGTPGYKKAAGYVAKQFDTIGLRPGGTKGYFQPVEFSFRQIDEAKSELSLARNGQSDVLTLGREANLNVREDSGRVIDAGAVFVGHALQVPEMKIDDLRGVDLKGKIAVYIAGAPKHLPGPLAAHAQSTAERWRALRTAGAVGVASISDPATRDIPWERSSLARLHPSLSFVDRSMIETAGQSVSITINPAHADRFLAGTNHRIAGLLELHRSGKPLPRFPLAVSIHAKTTFTSKPVVSDNVIGVLPGSDPKLAAEYIVLTGHLDHLGTAEAIKSDGVFNGAMDNASGIATLIEVAKALSKAKPKRSVLFAAVTAEEGGLMGSKYFAGHPTIPAKNIVANINFDMFLPIIPLKALTVYGMDESDLGAVFTSVARRFGIRAERDPEPARNAFIRSDQYSFIRLGIPALTFKFHAYKGTPEEKNMRAWLRERYHGLQDDVSQTVYPEDAVRFNSIMATFVQQVANQTQRPRWNQDSFFRRYSD